MLSWRRFLLGRRAEPEPELGAVPDMTGQGFGFGNIVAFSMGDNKERPSIGDVILLLDSSSDGFVVRTDRRVRVNGPSFNQQDIYGPESDPIWRVPTDDGELLLLPDLRRWKGVPRTWAYVT